MPKLIYHDSDGVDKSVDLGAEPTLIGRAGECHVQTQDALVSRRHARIIWDGGYWVEDLGSSNGVFVGGERVQRAPIRPGDEVRCGSLVMKLVPDVTRNPASRPPGGALATLAPPPPPAQGQAAGLGPGMIADAARRSPSGLRAAVPPVPTVAPFMGPSAEQFEEERARRRQAESAVLSVELRAATAEGKLADAAARAREAEARAVGAEAQVREAAGRAQAAEQAGREGEKLRRQVEQLRAEVRRLRGGSGEDVTNTDAVPAAAMVADVTAERDRLRAQIADLEAQLAQARVAAPGGGDAALLRRKVDQLTAEVRRLRGGQPGAEVVLDGGRVAELEARLADAERQRDEARAAAAVERVPADHGDAEKMRRMIEQLSSENRRLRQGPNAASPGAPVEDPRVAELTARVAQLERERAAHKGAAATALPAEGREALSATDDALADLRSSLRAANDEVGVLAVEASSVAADSVQVLKEALTAAGEQIETARAHLKELRAALKA